MRIDNYRGWADEPLPTGKPGETPRLMPRFDSTTLLGIDVSHHQNTIDFAKVKAAGAGYVFIKATEGETYVDPNFNTYRAGCKAAGLPRGFYHFFRPKTAGQKQIDLFCKTVGRMEPGDLPPVLDVEVPEDWTGFTQAQRVDMIMTWLKAVEARLGVRPIIYINNPMTNTVLGNPAAFAGYTLWLAHYTAKPAPSVPQPWTRWTFWQYTEHGTIAGITGEVDLNRFAGTAADLHRFQHFAKAPAAATFGSRFRGWLSRWFGWLGF